MQKVICSYCNENATLVTGKDVYPHRPDLYDLPFYRCLPCDAWVGCHKGTTIPLGRIAGRELRQAKRLAHAAFDPMWQRGYFESRRKAYKWLADRLGISIRKCHIGHFDAETCNKVVAICEAGNDEYSA